MTILEIKTERNNSLSKLECVEDTLTAAELISILEDYPGDTPVIICNGNTYNRIWAGKIWEDKI